MAALSDADRQQCARTWIQNLFVAVNANANLSYADIKAAADAADTWADNNQASFNTALPEPFKSVATLAQKTALLCYVAMKRAGLF